LAKGPGEVLKKKNSWEEERRYYKLFSMYPHHMAEVLGAAD